LDAPAGHPATWNKLLSAYLHDVMTQGILRIYADVSDQPLHVNTLAGVGFQVYSRQTIWRLFTPTVESYRQKVRATVRYRTDADEWALTRLYTQSVPDLVQQAEGWQGLTGERVPLLRSWLSEHGLTFVLANGLSVIGVVQAATGANGSWLQWWADPLLPNTEVVEQLLCVGLSVIRENSWRTPVYLVVADYQGGLSPLLSDYGFAPFSDRVKMVKQVAKWVREAAPAAMTVLEPTGEIVPTQFVPDSPVQGKVRTKIGNPL
jgi:hypothetical protein